METKYFLKITFVSVFAISIFGNMIKLANADNLTNIKDKANQFLKEANAVRPPHIGFVRAMLDEKNYGEVEKTYRSLVLKCDSNIVFELAILRGFDDLTSDNGITLNLLDAWVKETGSDISYTARGSFKSHEASKARGTAWAKDTPKENFEEMQKWDEDAARDLEAALKINPKMIQAYCCLIDIAKASNMPFTPEQIIVRALKQDNRSYYVRLHYIISLQPRWGGSHEFMALFADECAQLSNVNPLLWTLQGQVYGDIASYFWNEKDYQKAIDLFTKALEYGDYFRWLQYRGWCYYQLQDYEKAMADADQILVYRSGHREGNELKTYCIVALKRGN